MTGHDLLTRLQELEDGNPDALYAEVLVCLNFDGVHAALHSVALEPNPDGDDSDDVRIVVHGTDGNY